MIAEAKPEQTIGAVVPEETNQVVAVRSDTGVFEVIPIEEARNKNLDGYESITSIQTPIVRGGYKFDCLKKDISLIYDLYKMTGNLPQGRPIELMGPNAPKDPDYLILRNFPLPDHFTDSKNNKKIPYSKDFEDIVVVIPDYPDSGPRGVHIKTDSPDLPVIQKALEGHIFSDIIGSRYDLSGLKERGWKWVCFHHAGDVWNFNPKNISAGDCLAKYLETLIAAMSGAFSNGKY